MALIRCWIFALIAGLIAPMLARAAVMFSDSSFQDSDWTATKVLDTTSGSVATFTSSHVTTGGNPDAYRSISMICPAVGTFAVAHLRNGATYWPAVDGPIARMDLSYDYIAPGAVDFGGSDRNLPVIVQNNSYYVPTFFVIEQPGWHPILLTNRHPNDFFRVIGSGPSLPDFSATGAAMQFGYLTRGGNSSGQVPQPVSSFIDNWSIAVNVPEPAALAAIIVTGAVLLRRRA